MESAFGSVETWCRKGEKNAGELSLSLSLSLSLTYTQFSFLLTLYSIDTRFSLCWLIITRQLLKTSLEKKKLLVTSNFSFSPQCFLPNQIIVSQLFHIFDIISLFAAELEDPKSGIMR